MSEPLRLELSLNPEPSWTERCCRRVPFIGWTIANELEKRRLSLGLESLAQQLTSRPMPESHTNSHNDVSARVAAFIARTVKDYCGWPNDRFIPDDPYSLMMFGDEGAGIEVINAIEEYLDLPQGAISNEQIEAFYQMTFGQVIEYVVLLSKRGDPQIND